MTQCVFFQPFQLWPIFCFQIKQKVYFVFPLILIYGMPYTDEWNVRHLVLFPPPRFPETAELPPNVIRWPHLPQRNSLPHLTSWLLDLGNGYQSLQPVHTILQTKEVVHFLKTDGQVNEAFLGDVFNDSTNNCLGRPTNGWKLKDGTFARVQFCWLEKVIDRARGIRSNKCHPSWQLRDNPLTAIYLNLSVMLLGCEYFL